MPVSAKQNVDKQVDQLHAYPNNSRKHSDYQVKQLADFIKRVGYIDPIVIDEDDMILAGHCRALAAMRASMSTVPCLQVFGLTDNEKKAYVIADNKLALNASWDNELLKVELSEIGVDIDPKMLGFDMHELRLLDVDFELPGFDNVEGREDNTVNDYGEAKNDDEEFEFKDTTKGGENGDKKITLTVIFENDVDQENLFVELRDRGFKVKI